MTINRKYSTYSKLKIHHSKLNCGEGRKRIGFRWLFCFYTLVAVFHHKLLCLLLNMVEFNGSAKIEYFYVLLGFFK